MSCALILWIILIDAVLLRCFGLYGSQDQKEGVTWSLGIWMWLRTVLYGLAAQTQSLWLVSLNQLQKRDLELGLVIVLEMKENQWCRTYVNGFMGISCRRYTGFVPINFVSWCHGLEIEICIKNGHVNQRKGMAFFELFPYHAWKIVYTIWRRKHEVSFIILWLWFFICKTLRRVFITVNMVSTIYPTLVSKLDYIQLCTVLGRFLKLVQDNLAPFLDWRLWILSCLKWLGIFKPVSLALGSMIKL